jgi:RNA polymerase sigma-70 factor (ECF subfamily)
MNVDQNERFARLARAVADNRDKAAFTELFDFFAPRINAYLRSLGLTSGEAEDLAQEVMTVLWRKANLFDPTKSSLSTWLFRVARNRRIDAARREKTGKLDPDEPLLHPEPETSPDLVMDEQKRAERIRVVLSALPEEQFNLVRMAFFQGLTHSQIAAATDLPLGTVKSRIRLAFGRMRKALEEDSRYRLALSPPGTGQAISRS